MRTKNKIKKYLKLGIFLFGISFAMVSCMEDKEPLIKENSNLILTHSSFKKVIKQAKVRKITKKYLSLNHTKSNSSNFVIDTTNVQIVSSEYFTNYTFYVQTSEENDNVLNNYVLTIFNDSIFHQMLVTYPIIYGDKIDYDLNNINIEPIEGGMLIQKSFCDGYEVDSWVTTDHDCASGQHSGDGEVNDCDYGSGPNGPYTTGRWITTCINTGDVYIDEDGGGGAFNPSHGGSNNNNSDDEVEETVDIPVVPFGYINDKLTQKECKKIKNQINEQDFDLKQELDDLMTKTSENKEYSFEVLKNGDQNHRTGTQGLGIAMPNSSVSKFVVMAHSHDAFGEGNGTLSVFSFADLQSIAKYLFQNEIKTNKFVAYLVTEKGTRLALTINDSSKLLDFFYQYNHPTLPMNSPQSLIDKWTQTGKKQQELSKKYYETKNNNTPILQVSDNDNEEMLKQFLKFLKEADAGISVFEATDNNYDFKKVELDLLGNVIRKECN